ncbi:MAG: hypothetical protein QM758_30075 [Armatimonas sp.]
MRVLQIVACLFCIWLVFCRQETCLILLARSPIENCPENVDCCLGNIYDDTFPQLQKALKPAVQGADVYVNNVEGSTIYILSEPFWTEQQEHQAKKKLWKAAAGFFETPDVNVRLIDERSFGGTRWQLLGGIVGLLLLTIASRIRSRSKVG